MVRRRHGFVAVVMMTHQYQCTLATLPPQDRSVILRPQQRCGHHPQSVASMTTRGEHNLEAIFAEKKILRSKVKKDIRSMDPALRSHQDDAIQKLILEAPWFKSCKRLCAYISCSALREVDTSNLLQHVLHNSTKDDETDTRKILYVPRVEDKNCYMRMLNISRMDDLIANSMNILEPAPVDANGNEREDVMLANEPVDLLLLPGLAFDKTGRRLGRGGGRRHGFVAVVMMTHQYQCTLATLPPQDRSVILRPQQRCGHHPQSVASMTTGGEHNLEAIFAEKKILRSKVKKDIRSMDPALRSHQDDAIQKLILEAPWFKSCKRLCAYISCSALREVDTSNLLQHVLHNSTKDDETDTRKILYVPRVEDKNCYMRMLNISRMDDLIANSMNILEPAPVDANGNEREDVMLANEPVDLLLLPGLAFDKTGRRLGRGGGYYDTFLSKYQELARKRNWKQPLLIGLSYSVQIIEEGVIPLTPNDVFIDGLISSSGFIPISPAAHETCH